MVIFVSSVRRGLADERDAVAAMIAALVFWVKPIALDQIPKGLGWSVLGDAGGRGISAPSAAIFRKCRDHQAAYRRRP